ncbi:hypothetical protein OG746_08360 [Streptomyces sp. NBC_01016]|uniref:hypothetical protein n=1 Tax=Streptomyces sp. NBC_01016 TaxID=2903720 RepID=UPI00224DEF5D|nr:hypothetical protein [Streptomyces sp. NBC_01016]MCX4828736.1 hypothetical protein [Streptomyces sp. NBC_01016]
MEFTDAELLTQPMGYWAGAAQQAIVGHMNDSLGQLGIRQPHAWSLFRVGESEGGFTRDEAAKQVAETRPYVDVSVIDGAIGDLVEWGWLTEDQQGLLTRTETGTTAWKQVTGEVIPAAQTRLRAGVGDEEYVAAIKVLRRMITNVGGDAGFVA